MSRLVLVLICLFCLLTVYSCGVKIETGQTAEEATESNEQRASSIRREWAEQLFDENPSAVVRLVKRHIDSVSAMYIRYGFSVADEWHKGNEGRGVQVEASEMREVVDRWVATEKPILKAYEDNLEYGLRSLELQQYDDSSVLEILDRMAEQYYDTYSVVFYPNHNVESYEEELVKADNALRSLSEELERRMRKF